MRKLFSSQLISDKIKPERSKPAHEISKPHIISVRKLIEQKYCGNFRNTAIKDLQKRQSKGGLAFLSLAARIFGGGGGYLAVDDQRPHSEVGGKAVAFIALLFHSEDFCRVFSLFNLFGGIALVCYENSALFNERRAVFEQTVESCDGPGTADVELFAETGISAGVFGAHVLHAHTAEFKRRALLAEKVALLSHAFEQRESYVGAADFYRKGGETSARTYFGRAAARGKVLLTRKAVPDMLYEELFAFRDGSKVDLFVVLNDVRIELFKRIERAFRGDKTVFKLQNFILWGKLMLITLYYFPRTISL